MPKRMGTRSVTIGVLLGLLIVSVGAAFSKPTFEDGQYQLEEGDNTAFTFPLQLPQRDGQVRATVTFTLVTGPLVLREYEWVPDDCIESITVNGREIEDPALPFCDYANGRTLDLGDALFAGRNTISVELRNDGGPGGLRIRATGFDRAVLLLIAAGVLLVGIATLSRKAPLLGTRDRVVLAIVCLGILLRAGYTLQTPWDVRGYDADGHREYAQYVADHWKLPPRNEGWESYQPPLYYVIGGALLGAGDSVDLPQETQRRVLQSIGLIASILVLVFSVRIGTLLWPSSQARWRLRGFTLLLATLPGLVLAAARVNNDVLVHLFSVIALLTACTVLLHGKRMGYIVLGFWTALALLSKATALLLLPLFMLSILTVSSALRWPKRVKGAALFLCVVIALTWWLPVLRGAGPEGHAIVGNAGNLNSGLMLESTVTSFTVFSPVAIITHPFNNPWSDEDRRQYFWEYLYRGAFFGEFRFPDAVRGTAQVALAMGLPILLLGIIGFLKRRGEGRPLLQYMRIALVILLLGHVAFRLGFPYSSSQDFRYSVLVAIPIAAFCMHGIPTRKGVWRTAGMALVALFCMANAVFMAGVIGGFA